MHNTSSCFVFLLLKRSAYLLCSSVLILSSFQIHAQKLFHKSLIGDNTNGFCIADANPDGGYTIAGRMTHSGIAVVSFDACDNVKWTKNIDAHNGTIDLKRMAVTSSGEILLAGDYSNLHKDFFVIKLSDQGDLLFFKRYGLELTEELFSFGTLHGEGFFISGASIQNGASVPIVVVLDVNGDVKWSKSFADFGSGLKAEATKDGGMLLLLKNIIKIDAHGNVEWAKSYEFNSGNDYHGFMNPVEVNDGYIFTYYYSANQASSRSGSFKLDLNGEPVWIGEKFVGGTLADVLLQDNGNLMLLSMRYGNPDNQPIYLIELDDTGNVLRVINKKIPRENYQGYAFSLKKLFGGDIILTGYEKELLDIPTVRQFYVTRTNYDFDLDACGEEMAFTRAAKDTIEFTDDLIDDKSKQMNEEDVTPVYGTYAFTEDYVCEQEITLNLDIGNDTTLCEGEEIKLTSSHRYLTYHWSTGSTASSILVNEPGTYILTASNGCTSISDTIIISNYPALSTDYTISPLNTTAIEPVYFSTDLLPGEYVSWDFVEGTSNDAIFDHTFGGNGHFPVSFTKSDDYGCTYTDTTLVEIEYVSVFFPNTFTPDGDGTNDIFQPEGFGLKNYQLLVFNRWGDIIFSGFNEPWDGTSNGTVIADGTYSFKAQIEDDFGEFNEFSGVIRLMR